MPTSWALQPLQSPYQSAIKPLTNSYSYAPLSGSGYTSTGSTWAPQQPQASTQGSYALPLSGSRPTQTTASGSQITPQAQPAQQPTSGYSPAVNSALTGATNWSGTGQPGTNMPSYGTSNQGYDRAMAPQSTGTSSLWGSAGEAANQFYGTQEAQQHRGALSGPGAYEQWYAQNAGRYNQPTSLSSYWQSVQGRVQGQRFQPTNSQQAFDSTSGRLLNGTGVDNARNVSQQLQFGSQGEGLMGQAAGRLQGRNNATDYYGQNRSFYAQPGAIESYYGANGDQFQRAGFGEQNAQNILGGEDLAELYGNRLVGDELNYFRDPLRQQSYSEQLYESGNQGLNTFYDRENQKAQQALQDRMAAMGVFGSGETVQGMAEIDADMGAQHARDMAGLAGQADDQRLGRARTLMDFSGAAADEELARGGLMLEGANTGLQLDRDAISRLYQGGQLAESASRFGLDRTREGREAARSADDSLVNQARGLGDIGNNLATQSRERLGLSASTGLDADQEERLRLADYYGNASDLDQGYRLGGGEERAWLGMGADMAGRVDDSNLDWLNSGGGAAQTAQNMYEQRERYGFLDPLSLGSAMAGTYGGMSTANNTQAAQQRTEAVNLLMERDGLSAAEAERRAGEWMQAGTLLVQLAALRNR